MRKADLVSRVAKETGLTRRQADMAVDTVLGAIKNSLAIGDRVSLVGFGTFSVKRRAAREGRNPRTGKLLRIPAKKVPKFSPGRSLKKLVSEPTGPGEGEP